VFVPPIQLGAYLTAQRINHNLIHCEILEIGGAQGLFVAACIELGFLCQGLEPSRVALADSRQASAILGIHFRLTGGCAENLPYADESFDLLLAISVIEHVKDVRSVFQEAYRVLRPGGAFYSHTASSLCPLQNETRFFPCFSWYPDSDDEDRPHS
jgi:ubiquinone/menaquinone biosynthesis C-methylase UbiE